MHKAEQGRGLLSTAPCHANASFTCNRSSSGFSTRLLQPGLCCENEVCEPQQRRDNLCATPINAKASFNWSKRCSTNKVYDDRNYPALGSNPCVMSVHPHHCVSWSAQMQLACFRGPEIALYAINTQHKAADTQCTCVRLSCKPTAKTQVKTMMRPK